MEGIQPRDNQNIWNFVFAVFFVAVFGAGFWWLYEVNGKFPTSISVFDFVLIIFAVFRLMRLVVYDRIMKFFRDWFLDSRELVSSSGDIIFLREKPADGPRRTMADLLSCPWCTGMWFAPVVIFFYFLTPLAWIIILILAVGGMASLLQVFANVLGWRAEYLKKEAGK